MHRIKYNWLHVDDKGNISQGHNYLVVETSAQLYSQLNKFNGFGFTLPNTTGHIWKYWTEEDLTF